MSVIIRLQNLPWSANALDIRKYFHGLSIPEGGVHIVGGELGDAFIAFSTDEDARQAFNRNNGKIKEVQINLNLSSRTEMQRVIEAARNQSYAAFMQPQTTPLPTIVPAPLPAAIPEIKRDRKRSRSKSRERKDRSRERRRHRSRSRSRERRERRRRERSRSRGRSRSRERDRRTKRSEDRKEKTKIDVWSNQNSNESIQSTPQPSGIVGAFISNDETSRAISLLGNASNSSTNFAQSKINNNNNGNNRLRDSWPPTNFQNLLQNQQNFQNFGFQNNNNARGGPSAGTTGGGGGGGNFQNNRGGGFRNNFQRNDNFDYHEEREIDHDTCIQLEPFYGGYGDVRRFFHGIFISNKGIKFINDEWGHRTGIVYIQCGHKQGKIEALAKNGDHLNGIKVEVVHLDEKEFDEAVDRYVPSMDEYSQDSDESKGGRSSKFKSRNITKYFNKNSSDVDLKDFSCVIVEDLPTYVKEQDILHMFSLHPLFSLILTTKPRVGHIAYVKFSNSEVAQKALEEKSHHIVGGKPVTVRPCTDEEFETINKQHEVNIDDDVDKISDIGTDCLSISPLPAKINERDIADFFSDIGIIPSKIHLMKNAGGQAFCEFDSTEEATRAAQKDDTTLGNIHVSVKAVDRSEMQTALGLSPQPNLGSPPIMGDPQQQALIQRNLMAHSGGMNLNRPPLMQQHRPFFNNRGNFDNGLRGGPRFGPRGGPRHRFGPPNMMAMNNGGGNSTSNNDDAPPGCTVFMDNVPYKAGTNEILDFFDGYNITNNVSRRYNPNNTPSAEAKVQFHSPEDAFRAVQELNGQKIWDRLIYLKQA